MKMNELYTVRLRVPAAGVSTVYHLKTMEFANSTRDLYEDFLALSAPSRKPADVFLTISPCLFIEKSGPFFTVSVDVDCNSSSHLLSVKQTYREACDARERYSEMDVGDFFALHKNCLEDHFKDF